MDENLVEVEVIRDPVKVTIDFNKLTWGRVLEIQRAIAANADDAEAEQIVTKVVSEVTGQDAYNLPAFVVSKVLQEVLNFSNGGTKAKN